MMLAEFINASGIIFLSTPLGDNFARYINNDWDGPPEWWNETGLRVERSREENDQLRLRTARLSSILLANMCYPNLSIPHRCVSESAEVMAPWFDSVMDRYLTAQARMCLDEFWPRQPWVVPQAELASMVRRSRDSGL